MKSYSKAKEMSATATTRESSKLNELRQNESLCSTKPYAMICNNVVLVWTRLVARNAEVQENRTHEYTQIYTKTHNTCKTKKLKRHSISQPSLAAAEQTASKCSSIRQHSLLRLSTEYIIGLFKPIIQLLRISVHATIHIILTLIGYTQHRL